MAAGQKWFECQGYTSPSNRFKQLRPGDYVLFGASGRREASGVFRVEAEATRGLRLGDDLDAVVAAHLGPRMTTTAGEGDDDELISKLRSYLKDKAFVDYVPFREVWDLRPLRIACSDVFAALGATSPKQVASLVYLQPLGHEDLGETMRAFLAEHRSQLVHRTRGRPRWKSGVLKGEASSTERA